MSDDHCIRKVAEKYSQGHIFTFWHELSDCEQASLLKYAQDINFNDLQRIISQPEKFVTGIDERLLPPDPSICGSLSELRRYKPRVLQQYSDTALKVISEGKVAVLLLAGGQGTRLGVSYPKGLYKPNLPSGRSLYQIQAERLLRVAQMCKEKYGVTPTIPWYIMTSEHTKETTEKYFETHSYFGHKSENVIFFEQYTLPTLSLEGKILLESKWKISLAPDGNGGLYRALSERGVLDHMKTRGIEYIQVYCVDNILVKLPDLHFIGFCIDKAAECGAQVVQKVDPSEPIGVVGMVDGRYQVVEYSEISAKTAALCVQTHQNESTDEYDKQKDADEDADDYDDDDDDDDDGNYDGEIKMNEGDTTQNSHKTQTNNYNNNSNRKRLVYSHGNICVHFFTLKFLKMVSQNEFQLQMRYHQARKKVNHIDLLTGKQIVPSKPNAIKMEKFIFDIFQFAKKFAIWEVPRYEQFSPIKNANGALKDCPKTARTHLLHYHSILATNAGAKLVPQSIELNGNHNESIEKAQIEISPLISYAGENLNCLKGKELRGLNRLELDQSSGQPILIPASCNTY